MANLDSDAFIRVSAIQPPASQPGNNSLLACVDLAGILRGTHGERRRWVGAEWGVVW